MEFDCLSCGFANDLNLFMDEFARRGSKIFFTNITPTAKMILTLTILFLGIKVMIDRDQTTFSRSFTRVIFVAVVVAVFLSSPLLVFDIFLWPMQAFVVDVASAFMMEFSPAGKSSPPKGYAPMAEFVFLVESMVTWVVNLARLIASNSTWWPGDAIQRLVGAILLGAPWLWIIIIQCLFLIEAAFVFTLSGIMSPILLAVYIAPIGRPYLGAQLRVLLGAGLTIVFAAIVISFTGFAIQTHQAKVRSLLAPDGGDRQVLIDEAEAAQEAACNDLPTVNPVFSGDFDPGKNWIDQWSSGNEAANAAIERCSAARQALTDAVDPPFDLFDPYFMQLVVIGIISGLLHIKARTWASNLSGVQDGAGPAAAAATIMTGALGAGWAISKGLIGQGIGTAGQAAKGLGSAASGGAGRGSSSALSPNSKMGVSNDMRGNAFHEPYAPPQYESSSGFDETRGNNNQNMGGENDQRTDTAESGLRDGHQGGSRRT